MMPAINSMTLLRISVERKRITPMTNTAPAKAPATTARKPEKEKVPADTIPPPANMTKATPRLAPELIPKIDGSANGLLNTVCNIRPEAAPQHQAVTHKGTRDSHTMNDQASFSTVPPVNAPQTAPAGMSTEPSSRLAAANTKMTTTNIPPHTYPLRSTGIIFFSPLIYENICHLPPLPRPDGIFLSNLPATIRDGRAFLHSKAPSLYSRRSRKARNPAYGA